MAKIKMADAVKLTKADRDFKSWFSLVEAVIYAKTHLDWQMVLGDYMIRDAYDDGLSVGDLAEAMIEAMRDEATDMGFAGAL